MGNTEKTAAPSKAAAKTFNISNDQNENQKQSSVSIVKYAEQHKDALISELTVEEAVKLAKKFPEDQAKFKCAEFMRSVFTEKSLNDIQEIKIYRKHGDLNYVFKTSDFMKYISLYELEFLNQGNLNEYFQKEILKLNETFDSYSMTDDLKAQIKCGLLEEFFEDNILNHFENVVPNYMIDEWNTCNEFVFKLSDVPHDAPALELFRIC